jgi:hypothetical protein
MNENYFKLNLDVSPSSALFLRVIADGEALEVEFRFEFGFSVKNDF